MVPRMSPRGSSVLLPLAMLLLPGGLLVARLSTFVATSGRPAPGRRGGVPAAATKKGSAAEGAAPLGAVGAAAGGAPEEAAETPSSSARAALFDLLMDEYLPSEVLQPEGKPMRGRMDEAILRLERLTPTHAPASSGLLDGTWVVKYASSYAPGLFSSPTRELALFLYGGGFSLGSALSSFAGGFWGKNFGIVVSDKKVRISGQGRDVEASAEVEVAGRKETLKYSAQLTALSAQRVSEEVLEFRFPNPVGVWRPLSKLTRNILLTYLDQDIMIVRDETGSPEVLVRELVPVTLPEGTLKGEVDSNVTNATTDAVSTKNATSLRG